MDIDLELYRRELHISSQPLVRLSVIDISPDRPQRTLVFLHGFGGHATQWMYQLQKFSLENRVIAFDLRGHGQSDKPPSKYNMAQILDDLRVALNVLGVNDKIVLLGHSFGGSVAAEFAAKWPERVERLVLIATATSYKLNPLYRFALHLPLWLLRFVAPFTRPWLWAPPHVLKPWYFNTLVNWNGRELFQKLRVPTLVIRGHRDIVFERPMFEEVTRLIPGAQEADISASGHMVMLERREAVDRLIERFLAGETQKSWREPAPVTTGGGRDALRRERPWLAHYEAGVPYTIGIPRVPVHHLLRSAVRRFPRNTAIVFEGSRMSYRRLNREVNRFANALLGLGLGKGARVVLLLPNVPQMVVGFYGTLKTGAVAVFIPPMTDPEELIRQVRESEANLLVTLTAWVGLACQVQAKTNLPHIVLTGGADYLSLPKRLISRGRNRGLAVNPRSSEVNGALSWRRWLAGQSPRSPGVAVSPEDLAVIQYTGGTTAEAKGVMLTHRNLVANTLQTRQWMPDAREGDERALSVLPFSHIYGLTTALNVPVAFGAMLILKPQFQVLDVLKAIKRYHPTIFPGVPNMYVAINNFRGVRRFGVGSIKACISGSAPLPVEVQEAFEKLTRGHLVEGYGLTEASPVTHANPLDGMRKVGSIGIPLPSTEACVVDLVRGRKEVPAGHIGELAVRGPQVMLGYWKDPEATACALTGDGWLLTGDVAQMDADGYFRIIARKAEMWYPTRPGKPAFPRDVEEVLYEVPQVKEAAVVAIAGQPIAFVIAQREHPTAESLVAYCQRRLPPELVPRLVIFSDDFPRSFIGKVLRRELAKRYEQSHAG